MDIPIISPVQEIKHPLLTDKQIRLFVKRDDLIHPYISGNKWRKLKYTLQDARLQDKTHLITFGGAYSNHLLATACAGQLFGFVSTGWVRGELTLPLNPVLSLCKSFGMKLIYSDRESYRDKKSIFTQHYQNDPIAYFIDEGGASSLAVNGVAELIQELPEQYDFIFTACGTGATLAGIALGLQQASLKSKAIGIAVLKGADFLNDDIKALIPMLNNWEALLEHHHGGYAKTTTALQNWMADFTAITQIPLEPVYTGKLFYAIFQLIATNHFAPHSRLLAIHTGGIIQ